MTTAKTSFRYAAFAAVTAAAVIALPAPSSAQQRERAHGAAICAAPGKITCAPSRYAQAGDPCACKDMLGRLVRGRVAWK